MVKPGRGKGGLATVWKKGLTKYVSKIKCDIFRIQATKFNFPNAELLVLKELSLCHKLGFLNPNFFRTKCRRP